MAFGIDDAVAAVSGIIGKVIDRAWPDPAQQAAAQFELLKLRQTGELAQLVADTDLAKGQLEINKIEAASSSTLVAGARPFILWTCGVAFGYVAVLEPVLRFVFKVGFGYEGDFPAIDTTMTMQVLLGILGLGALRTAEKFKGVARQ